MAVHNAPGGYIQFDQAYGRLLQSKDHFETRQIFLDALRGQKIRAHYFDGAGKKRDLSPSFWIMVESNGLNYLNPFERGRAWERLTAEGWIEVEDPLSRKIERICVLFNEAAFTHLFEHNETLLKSAGNATSICEAPEESTQKNLGGAPRKYDETIFAVIAASLFAFKGAKTYSNKSRWFDDAAVEYQRLRPDDGAPSDAWGKKILRHIESTVRLLNSIEEQNGV